MTFAVENMFPLRVRGREVSAYAPDWDPTTEPHRAYTLDLSHTAVSHSDAVELMATMGDRLAHVHIADGSGAAKDEHLVPGRGTQPCGELLERLAGRGFGGSVVVEVNTRRAADRAEREADLAEALAFTRLHLVAAAPAGRLTRLPYAGRMRSVILAASRNDRFKQIVAAAPITRSVVRRFVPGEGPDDAVEATRRLVADGLRSASTTSARTPPTRSRRPRRRRRTWRSWTGWPPRG